MDVERRIDELTRQNAALAAEVERLSAVPENPPLTSGQILALERRSEITDDEAIRYARSVEAILRRNRGAE